MRLSEVLVGRLLRKLGFSPQKPLYRAYQQNPEAVQRWLPESYPAIKRQAELEGALIYFGDEAAMRSDFHRGPWVCRYMCCVTSTWPRATRPVGFLNVSPAMQRGINPSTC